MVASAAWEGKRRAGKPGEWFRPLAITARAAA
jgi:hypothetical protein